MGSFTFPLFPRLPTELRMKIWRVALPDEDRPALYPYKRGCWCPRWLSPSDPGYDPNCEPNIDLEFRHDLLEDIQVDLPPVFVNREARGIALTWAHQHDIKMRFCKNRQCHVFTRPFKLERDVLYIAPNRSNDFFVESIDRLEEPDLFDQIVNISPALARFAIPRTQLETEEDPLREQFDNFVCLAVLFVIVNTPPPEFPDNEMKVQRWWELRSAEGKQGRAFLWNHDRRALEWENGESYIKDEALYRHIEEASKGLIPTLVGNRIRSFEIRPIFAVRK